MYAGFLDMLERNIEWIEPELKGELDYFWTGLAGALERQIAGTGLVCSPL